MLSIIESGQVVEAAFRHLVTGLQYRMLVSYHGRFCQGREQILFEFFSVAEREVHLGGGEISP